ncbi:HCLS1-binding protein 3 [Myripristis murdjan]|uniref:PX domain-containing protein n=1 Tax=Myripristis murdjan TaxID=586833 RepID=A0A667XMY3_9TELE|nr:HCLS1-binding protein 3 [Myripristis murdjan]
MPDGLITSRPLQNESTGIDLQVPLYQEVRGSMMTGHVEYQIIVVTRLSAFKSSRHKPGDTVQLVVSKKYSDIDEFYNRLVSQYPKIALPAMPRKVLFVGEDDIKERRAAFDELVKFIAKNPTLATCSELLEFLGARSVEADIKTRNILLGEEPDEDMVNFFQDDGASGSSKGPVFHPVKAKKEKKIEDEEEEPYLGPLGNAKEKKKAEQPRYVKKPEDSEPAATDLFNFPTKEGNLRLFEGQDLGGTVVLGDSLLLPTAYNQAKSAGIQLDEDIDELYRVEDDFDKLFKTTKQIKDKPPLKPKPKPKPAEKPALTPKVGASLESPPVAVDQLKDQMDILSYIQQNELDADNEDLF